MKTTNRISTIRNLLYSIFFLCILLPVLCIMVIIPSYYRNQMTRETISLVSNNLESISDTILIYLSDIQKLASVSYFNEDLRTALYQADSGQEQSIEYLNEVFPNYLKMLREEVLSIIIISGKDSVFYYHRNQNIHLDESYEFSFQEWLARAGTDQGGTNYLGAHVPEYFDTDDSYEVFSLIRTINHPYIDRSLGVVIVDAEKEIFEEAFSVLPYASGAVSVLMDKDDNILYSSEEIPDALHQHIRQRPANVRIDGIDHSVLYKRLPLGDWTICVLLSSEDINRRVRVVYLVGFLAAGITLLITSLLFRYMTDKFIARPIHEMSLVMKRIEQGDLTVRCHPVGGNEISSLAKNLNTMIEELNSLIDREYRLVIRQKQAEYRALQAHIKPHFLYNTLNSMVALNRIGQRGRLENAIVDLTSMLRYSLSELEGGITRLADEFLFIEQYVDLQRIRFEDRLITRISCDSALSELPIPKLLLQPLVENAVLHNMEKTFDAVTIGVEASLSEGVILIRVTDDGLGYDTGVLVSENAGIGISNVRERLQLCYPEADLSLSSEIGSGTTVSIRIPVSASFGLSSRNEETERV